jgi:hypothetical protein
MTDIAQTFQCPSCGASLEIPSGVASMKCGYCGTSVVIPQELRSVTQTNFGNVPQGNLDFGMLLSKAIRMGEVVRLARAGDKANAIKLYQENSGASTEQAEKVIEAIVSSTHEPTAMQMNQPGFEELGQAAAALESAREARQEVRQEQRRRARPGNYLFWMILIGVGVYYYLSTNGMLPTLLNFLRSLTGK